jgi:hypothetical protein
MMLAEAGDIDVTNQDHFVMVLSKDSIIDHVCGLKLPFSLWGWEWMHARGKKKIRGGIKNLPGRRSS